MEQQEQNKALILENVVLESLHDIEISATESWGIKDGHQKALNESRRRTQDPKPDIKKEGGNQGTKFRLSL